MVFETLKNERDIIINEHPHEQSPIIRVNDADNLPDTFKKEINAVIRIKKAATMNVKFCSVIKPVIINTNPKTANNVGTEYFFNRRPMLDILK